MYVSDTNIIKFRHLTVQELKIFGDEIFLNVTLTENMESVDKKADTFFEVIETIINFFFVFLKTKPIYNDTGADLGGRGRGRTPLFL